MRHSDDEIICMCNAVTYGELRKVIESGAESLTTVQERLHIGNGCGSCINSIEAYILEISSNLQ